MKVVLKKCEYCTGGKVFTLIRNTFMMGLKCKWCRGEGYR